MYAEYYFDTNGVRWIGPNISLAYLRIKKLPFDKDNTSDYPGHKFIEPDSDPINDPLPSHSPEKHPEGWEDMGGGMIYYGYGRYGDKPPDKAIDIEPDITNVENTGRYIVISTWRVDKCHIPWLPGSYTDCFDSIMSMVDLAIQRNSEFSHLKVEDYQKINNAITEVLRSHKIVRGRIVFD